MNVQRSRREREQGSAMIVVMIVIMMLMLLAVSVAGISTTRSNTSIETAQLVPAQGLAEVGIGAMLDQVETTDGADFSDIAIETAIGTVAVSATNDAASGLVRVDSLGTTRNGVQVRIEAYLLAATHPAFNKAIYVGNKDGANGKLTLGPSGGPANPSGSETTDPNWDSNHETNGDYVEGDIWVNGDIDLHEDTTVWGDVDTTKNNIQGDVVTGTVTTKVSVVDPPDLLSMNYETRPETTLLNDPNNIPSGLSDVFYASKGANHAFYGGPLDTDNDGTKDAVGIYDNQMFHLGQHNGGNRINFETTDNGKIFYVKGNLWIHSDSARTLSLPDNRDIQVTIVIEGNLYISDDLNYGSSGGALTNSGILFIAKGPDSGNRESFVDENKNYRYDPGEQIINDGSGDADGNPDGVPDGIYDGPREGVGNVYFGDGYYGTGGVTHGFMYAENNAYLSESADNSYINSDYEKIYGVYGFLSAGGILDLGDRTSGNYYRNYKVKYNSGIQDGSLNIPGLPKNQGGGYAGLQVIGWRVIPTGS